MDPIGPKPTDKVPLWDAIETALLRAYERPFTTRSDFARDHSEAVAAAGQIGWLTTKDPNGMWTNTWRITAAGLRLIERRRSCVG